MMRLAFGGPGKVLALVAALIFFVAAIGEWPSGLDDFEPVALGLAVLAVSLALP